MRVLIAGLGNVLRTDDGFGVVVAGILQGEDLPDEVEVIEVGIGGIHLVQQLMDEMDALIVVDAVDFGLAPGTVLVLEPDIEDVATLPLHERHDKLADMHYATPERALMLARALAILPERIWIVGCQPQDAESMGHSLSPAVEGAVPEAIGQIRRLVNACGVGWVDVPRS
jgi:hydrogenase maturation protease